MNKEWYLVLEIKLLHAENIEKYIRSIRKSIFNEIITNKI